MIVSHILLLTTERDMLSCWQNLHHWLHQKLSILTSSGSASDENIVNMTLRFSDRIRLDLHHLMAQHKTAVTPVH